MSAGKEFRVNGAAIEKARRESSVCVSGERPEAERRMNEEPELVRGSVPYQVAEICRSGCSLHLVSQYRATSHAVSLEANGATGAK